MEKSVVEQTAEILRRLSPQNQMYFMSLVKLAEVAENGVKKELSRETRDKAGEPDT